MRARIKSILKTHFLCYPLQEVSRRQGNTPWREVILDKGIKVSPVNLSLLLSVLTTEDTTVLAMQNVGEKIS